MLLSTCTVNIVWLSKAALSSFLASSTAAFLTDKYIVPSLRWIFVISALISFPTVYLSAISSSLSKTSSEAGIIPSNP